MTADDFDTVLNEALEAHKIKVVESEDYTIAEILPDVYEIVSDIDAYDMGEWWLVFEDIWDREDIPAGSYLYMEPQVMDDGRWSTVLVRK